MWTASAKTRPPHYLRSSPKERSTQPKHSGITDSRITSAGFRISQEHSTLGSASADSNTSSVSVVADRGLISLLFATTTTISRNVQRKDMFLKQTNITTISYEERREVESRTRGQNKNKQWSEERLKCLHAASNYREGFVKQQEITDLDKLANSFTQPNI